MKALDWVETSEKTNSHFWLVWLPDHISMQEPSHAEVLHKLTTNLKDSLSAFKPAKYFSLQKISAIQPNTDAISSLLAFPFFSAEVLEGLKAELPTYLAKVTNVAPKLSCADGWKLSETSLPHCSAAACRVPLVRTSAAASE